MFVVGVVGLAAGYQTHYSVMLKVEEEAHYTVMKEGVPSLDEMKELIPSNFLASIHNPNITKITF